MENGSSKTIRESLSQLINQRGEQFRELTSSASKHAKDWMTRGGELRGLWKFSKVQTWKNQRELERLLDSLPQHQDELDAFSENVGAGFLALASSLEKMTKLSEQLVPQSEQLLTLSNGDFEEEAVLESAAELLKPALDFLDECGVRSGEIAGRLEYCRRNIRELLALQGALQSTIQPLNYIQTLFKIECAALPEAVQTLFVSVTSDISRLEKQVEAMFEEKFTALTGIDVSLSHVLERMQQSLSEQRRLVCERRREIEATLEQLNLQLSQNTERYGRLSARTQRVAEKVNAIVTGLQAHDIVSQKLQHVVRDLEEFSVQQHEHHSVLAFGSAAKSANEMARIQESQLSAVTRDVQHAHRQINQSIDAVLSSTNAVHAGATTLEEYKSVTVSTEGMIQGLLDSLQCARTMMVQVLTEADEIYGVVETIGNSANALTATIMELAISMHFIALNAQIQAVQIGAGTGLEMLSARTAELSSETSTLSEQALQGLERVATSLKEITTDFNQLRAEGSAQRQVLMERGQKLESKLHALRDQSQDCLQRIEQSTAGIQNLCESMQGDLPSEESTEEELQPTRKFLAKILEVTRSSLNTQTRQLSERDRLFIKQKYTMESERLAHEGAVTGVTVLTNSSDQSESHGEIDLFTDEITPTENKEPATANSSESSIELF